ncbi:hypothetical protein A2U01_0013903, partial [Trifolium medium]|nr:hypothetical protein [Trifolium medium]
PSQQSNELKLEYCGCTVYYMFVAAGSERRHVHCPLAVSPQLMPMHA